MEDSEISGLVGSWFLPFDLGKNRKGWLPSTSISTPSPSVTPDPSPTLSLWTSEAGKFARRSLELNDLCSSPALLPALGETWPPLACQLPHP